jgi:hypothetical protein
MDGSSRTENNSAGDRISEKKRKKLPICHGLLASTTLLRETVCRNNSADGETFPVSDSSKRCKIDLPWHGLMTHDSAVVPAYQVNEKRLPFPVCRGSR